ncbi:MAG: hypothetical protein U0894_03125 [Pirellulales bacterium]
MQFRDVIRNRPTITIPDDHEASGPSIQTLRGENGSKPNAEMEPMVVTFIPSIT